MENMFFDRDLVVVLIIEMSIVAMSGFFILLE